MRRYILSDVQREEIDRYLDGLKKGHIATMSDRLRQLRLHIKRMDLEKLQSEMFADIERMKKLKDVIIPTGRTGNLKAKLVISRPNYGSLKAGLVVNYPDAETWKIKDVQLMEKRQDGSLDYRVTREMPVEETSDTRPQQTGGSDQ
jgi:hypothetical protein